MSSSAVAYTGGICLISVKLSKFTEFFLYMYQIIIDNTIYSQHLLKSGKGGGAVYLGFFFCTSIAPCSGLQLVVYVCINKWWSVFTEAWIAMMRFRHSTSKQVLICLDRSCQNYLFGDKNPHIMVDRTISLWPGQIFLMVSKIMLDL